MSNKLAAFNASSLLSTSVRGTSNVRYLSSQSVAYALERLALIEPEIVAGVPRTMQAYAFAYLDHYRGNVPLLERERDFLIAALVQSWQMGQYVQVVRLLDGLLYLLGRFATFVSITDLLGSYEAADQFVAMLLHASDQHDPGSLVVALLARGFHARLGGATDVAYADLTTILQLLSVSDSGCSSSTYKQLFSMQVQDDLQRAEQQRHRSGMVTRWQAHCLIQRRRLGACLGREEREHALAGRH